LAFYSQTKISKLRPTATEKPRLTAGLFVFDVVQFIYMKFIILVIGGFILLMMVNKFLGGTPI
jgi:hypothetical protein